MTQLQKVPVGAIVRHPAWPRLYWEVIEHQPVLTHVRRIGGETLATLYARDLVEIVEDPDPLLHPVGAQT